MSGEFGSCDRGYFHVQIAQAAEDCLQGRDTLTKLWGEFLKEFAPIAGDISYSEASDCSEAHAILENIKRKGALKNRLLDIEKYLSLFEEVSGKAISELIELRKVK